MSDTQSTGKTPDAQAQPATKPAKTYKSLYIYPMVIYQTLGTMLFYCMSAFNPIQEFVQYHGFKEPVPKIVITLMTSFVPLGAAFGSLTSGKIASTWGRKKPVLFIDAVSIVGTVLTLLPSAYSLLIGRLIQGYCIGANSSLVPLYINEVSPNEISGKLGTFNQLFIGIGQLIPNLLGLGMPLGSGDNKPNSKFFLLILGLAGIFPVLRIIFTLTVFNHETPKYYLTVSKETEAKTLLNKMYLKERAESEFASLKDQQEAQARQKKVTLREILSAKYRRRLIVGIVVASMQQIFGVNAIIFFTNTIFSIGSAKGTQLPQIYTIIVCTLSIIGPFCSGLYVERFGRKPILVVGLAFCGALIGGFGILSIINPTSTAGKWLVWAYMLAYGGSIGPISWVYIADILPEVGLGIATLVLWLIIFLIGLIFPSLPDGGISYAFIFFAVCSFLGMFFCMIYMKETKGKNSAEIAAMFGQKVASSSNDLEQGKETLSIKNEENPVRKASEALSLKTSNSGNEVEQTNVSAMPGMDNQQVDINIGA